MGEHDITTSGTNDDSLSSGTFDEENEDNFNDDENQDNQDQDDEGDEDGDGGEELDRSGKPISKSEKHRLYAITNLQNRKIKEMEKEISQLRNKNNLSEDDLAKIREKYSEEDLEVIEKIIEKKANELLDKRQSTSLAQKEMNIFLKEHPELDDPEIRHIKSLQKEYGYSLKKAYSILFGKNEVGNNNNNNKPKHSISNSFGGDSRGSSKNNSSNEDSKAMKDMEEYMGK